MSHISLCCTLCGASHAADMTTLRCGECASPLEVRYGRAEPEGKESRPGAPTGPSVPLPMHDPTKTVSLGQGNTPCVELASLAGVLGIGRLFAKLEMFNPTGSFKDRGSAVMMSMANELGAIEVVEDSSGNAGASVAAYAARAGIKAHVFAPANAPAAKIGQIKIYGAEAHLIEGSREAATAAAVEFCAERRLVYASHNLSPYFIEGTKTFAYEVAQQLARVPLQHLVVPVGNGSLYIGAWKGFRELQEAGYAVEMPRLHCIQSRAAMPIAAAYRGEGWSPDPDASTVAGGIAAATPPRKQQILDVLRVTDGVALEVGDRDILRWQRLLADREGVYGEPTSAAALAGLEVLVLRGDVGAGDSVLVPITGSGLKDAPPA